MIGLLLLLQMPRPLLPTPAVHGFIPGPPALFNPAMPFIHPAPPVEPPLAKKPRSEMDSFISEHDFIAANPVSPLEMLHVHGLIQLVAQSLSSALMLTGC